MRKGEYLERFRREKGLLRLIGRTLHVSAFVTVHVAGKIQRAGMWLRLNRRGISEFSLPSRGRETSLGHRKRWRRGVRTREIPPTFSGVTISSHLSAALAARSSGKPIRGNLLDSPPTDMPQEIPRVSSQRSRSLLSSLGQSFSPAALSRRSPLRLQPVPRRSRRSFSRPLQTLWILQGEDTAGLSKFQRGD